MFSYYYLLCPFIFPGSKELNILLILEAITLVRTMPGDCHFQNKWLLMAEFEKWLKPSNNSKVAFCSLCMKDINLGTRGISNVRSHASSKMHLDIVKSVSKQVDIAESMGVKKIAKTPRISPCGSNDSPINSTSQTSSSTSKHNFIAQSSSYKDNITKAEILFCLKLVASHTPLHFAADLNEMLRMAFPDSDIASGFQLGNNKAAYTINHGIAIYYERKNLSVVAKCKFLVAQFDESLNKISQRGQMDLHLRYVNDDNMIESLYLTSAFLGKATANLSANLS